MSSRLDDDRIARARQARQVISGAEVRPPSGPASVYANSGPFTPSQRTYLISVLGLLVLGVLLLVVFSMGVASIIFFLLALTLIAGWLVF
jgi:Flp pilus assembly protein TadB